MVIIAKIPSAVVVPSAGRVNQTSRVEGAHHFREGDFGVGKRGDLAPPFVVDDPRYDAGVASVL